MPDFKKGEGVFVARGKLVTRGRAAAWGEGWLAEAEVWLEAEVCIEVEVCPDVKAWLEAAVEVGNLGDREARGGDGSTESLRDRVHFLCASITRSHMSTLLQKTGFSSKNAKNGFRRLAGMGLTSVTYVNTNG